MITYQIMSQEHVNQLGEIDRSEHIDLIYVMDQDQLLELEQNHECPNWNEDLLEAIKTRYLYEIQNGGLAVGAFSGSKLAGFGVLAHKFRGIDRDRLQVDLMYVSREYRRQGIGTRILTQLGEEARSRGAKYLYISSTETRSAVSFYKSQGSQITNEVDQELYDMEPQDIHMIKKL
ncbi:GNAT family N-acetyltransferase [Paenibacillaceae bacterium WGS1546]|uniref:GNAT family N-acetyltransferase n=1 Tax=Cohnella sp. WGS1546 TaxID=3366810 RepID=UPI00372D68A2